MGDTIQIEIFDPEIAVITFNDPGRKLNTLRRSVLMELSSLVTHLEKMPHLKGALFQSGKAAQFVAGADLHELAALRKHPEEITPILDLGCDSFNRIAKLPFPTVALIGGPCLGGGLELALAMDGRIVSGSETILGFPEVKVGLIPGWGGTQRLPRLIGEFAIEMIESGEAISAARALELGLVDDIFTDKSFERGLRWIEQSQKISSWREQRERLARSFPTAGWALDDPLANVPAGDPSVHGLGLARQKALSAIRKGIRVSLEEGLAIERKFALDVFGSADSASLISVFFLKSRAAKDSGVHDPSVIPLPIGQVGIIGAGQMGSGIAEAHARVGIPVVMVDVDNTRLVSGIDRVHEIQDRRASRKEITPERWKEVLDLVSTSTSLDALSNCDLVIEAVTEDEAIKIGTFRKLAGILPSTAIVASNTSTIPIGRMAGSAPELGRFAGMHFFHPVERMELVEVIRGPESADQVVATIVALAKRLGKSPIVVRDCPGFLTTRLLFFYLREAVRLLEEGVKPNIIDSVAVDFGMPMGPIGLMDFIGLDTVSAIFKVMAGGYPDRAERSALLEEMVAAGRLGRKTKSGFRMYARAESNAPDPILDRFQMLVDSPPQPEQISDRLFLTMLFEATRLLDEKIVRQPADIDLGVILGLAFPAHRGGLLRWADDLGIREIVDRLSRLRQLGGRFQPTERLIQMADRGETFYPAD